ncbi:MAG: hemolysin family protein [Deltaproteobacteria bacterium]|nr:hemolysin family protein [Deltaproteobacteria bacterium]
MIFLIELLIIIILVFVNGFFSAAEIAVVTVRKTRVRELVNKKVPFAKVLEKLKSDIEKFFVTIQIGITIVGTLASVIAGTISVKYLTPLLSEILPELSEYNEAIGVALTTFTVTFIFLLFGELLPKSIAARSPEGIALVSSSFIDLFSKIMKPFIFLINIPHRWIVRLVVRQKIYSENKISEDEIRLIIEEGVLTGVIEKQEQELIEKIFGFTDRKAKDIMIGIESVDMISIDCTKEEIVDRIISTGHSRFPVYEGKKDNITGIMTARDFYYVFFESEAFILRDILRKPIFVSSEEKISSLLREMQKRKIHMAIVRESENVIGIITLEDIVEEIVGEIEDERFAKII